MLRRSEPGPPDLPLHTALGELGLPAAYTAACVQLPSFHRRSTARKRRGRGSIEEESWLFVWMPRLLHVLHLFSIKVWTLYTRSRASFRICLVLCRSAISGTQTEGAHREAIPEQPSISRSPPRPRRSLLHSQASGSSWSCEPTSESLSTSPCRHLPLKGHH